MKQELVAYLRNEGPNCYETKIFNLNNRLALKTLIEEMLSTELIWYWISARTRLASDEVQDTFLPEERSLTPLNSDNINSFIDDLSETDEDGYGRFIAVFGFNNNICPPYLTADQFKSAVIEFLENEEGALCLILVQVGDSPWEHIYVSHSPQQKVKRLLNAWNILPSEITWKRSYKELYTAQIESFLNSIYKVASG